MDKWNNPRIHYLHKIIKSTSNTCPECEGKLTYDEQHSEHHCNDCGLVTSGPIEYVSLTKINYPYGRH